MLRLTYYFLCVSYTQCKKKFLHYLVINAAVLYILYLSSSSSLAKQPFVDQCLLQLPPPSCPVQRHSLPILSPDSSYIPIHMILPSQSLSHNLSMGIVPGYSLHVPVPSELLDPYDIGVCTVHIVCHYIFSTTFHLC